MAGMDEKDKKEVDSMIKQVLTNEQKHLRQIEDMVKLTSQDKDLSKLTKAMLDTHKPFHRAARAVLDAMK